MPLPLTVSCFSKIQIGFTFMVPAYLGSPGKRAVKRVCVCVCFLLLSYIYCLTYLLSSKHGMLSPFSDTVARMLFGWRLKCFVTVNICLELPTQHGRSAMRQVSSRLLWQRTSWYSARLPAVPVPAYHRAQPVRYLLSLAYTPWRRRKGTNFLMCASFLVLDRNWWIFSRTLGLTKVGL